MQIKLTSQIDPQRLNVLGLGRQELLSLISDLETQPKKAAMRVNQLWSWIYCHGISSFDKMTNIDKNLRSKLKKVFKISRLNIEKKEVSNDGTTKYLFCLEDQSKIETVFIPEETRGTLCISSQVGCTLSCSFCHTGTQKLVRNLSSQEIIGQVIAVYDDLGVWKKMKSKKCQSSSLEIITNKMLANKISPSILLLSDSGTLGIRIVNSDGVVEFLPIKILEDTQDGLWVKGIPNASNLIVRGQGFVENGQKVIAIPATES